MSVKFSNEQLFEMGTRVGVVLLIILVTLITAKVIRKIMSKKDHFIRIDSTQYKFLSHFISGIIYFLGAIIVVYSIPSTRGIATAIFASSGVLAVIIGFASQQAFSNIVSGIFIAIFKPFRIGDRLRIEGKNFLGIIEDITLRHTVLRTLENKRIIIPNSVISSEILENENIIDSKILKFWDIGISYDSDVVKAKKIIKEEAIKHPEFIDNRSQEDIDDGEEPVRVRVTGYGDSTVNLRAFIWAKDPAKALRMGYDLNESVKERFDREGIEIPFPYRTLVFKNPEEKENLSNFI